MSYKYNLNKNDEYDWEIVSEEEIEEQQNKANAEDFSSKDTNTEKGKTIQNSKHEEMKPIDVQGSCITNNSKKSYFNSFDKRDEKLRKGYFMLSL